MSKIAECDECGAKWDARIFEGDDALAECPKCVEHAYFQLKMSVPVLERKQRIEVHAGRILSQTAYVGNIEHPDYVAYADAKVKMSIAWATLLVDEIDKLEE
jgi:hypothetical protein